MNAKELILKIIDSQVGKPVEAGHNGPYIDPETNARNLGHWVILFARAFEWTGDDKYKQAMKEYADQLMAPELRPAGASFHHRDKEGKDHSNGLMGQAWSIEALVKASAISGDPVYRELALDVWRKHSFNEYFGLWHILETDGRTIELDPTFNHQLWFASAVSHFYTTDQEAKDQLERFFSTIGKNLTVLHNGLIFHPIDRNLQNESEGVREKVSAVLQKLKIHPAQIKRRYAPDDFTAKQINKSEGYHAFNLVAFEIIRKNAPDLAFWNSSAYKKIIAYGRNRSLLPRLDGNTYAYPYNAPGFEFPFVYSLQPESKELLGLAQDYLQEQLRQTFDEASLSFKENNPDPVTLTARLYELAQTDGQYLEKIKI